MTATHGDQPAFPLLDLTGRQITASLTKREHFASMFMQALLSNPQSNRLYIESAELAVKAAYALISELNKQ